MFKHAFGVLQKVGKSLMLPVAVLPVAGLLLGLGATDFHGYVPAIVLALMKNAGDVIFANLPLIFAIGVALGFTENDGVSGIAATIGYLVMTATLGVIAKVEGIEPDTIMGIPSIQTGVFGGILAGGLAAWMFNRYYRIALPAYLGFFAGKRFVPIVTAIGAIVLGGILSVVWPPIGGVIKAFSQWAAVSDPRTAATVYGFVERLLIPFGLHHIWNVPFFFEAGSYLDPTTGKVVHGDITRFFAGDHTAGILAGAFLFKMFGLPAAAIAIWHCARPEKKVAVGGMMISAALTSFLTGITEPIEFAFLFVAPVLYFIHACLAASAQFVANTLGMRMGFTFSQGGIDFLMFNLIGNKATHAWYVFILGPIYAVIYYGVFRFVITRFNLKTPGREDDTVEAATVSTAGTGGRSRELVLAFGGRANIAEPGRLHHASAHLGERPGARQRGQAQGARRRGCRAGRQRRAGDLRAAVGEHEDRHAGIPEDGRQRSRPRVGRNVCRRSRCAGRGHGVHRGLGAKPDAAGRACGKNPRRARRRRQHQEARSAGSHAPARRAGRRLPARHRRVEGGRRPRDAILSNGEFDLIVGLEAEHLAGAMR